MSTSFKNALYLSTILAASSAATALAEDNKPAAPTYVPAAQVSAPVGANISFGEHTEPSTAPSARSAPAAATSTVVVRGSAIVPSNASMKQDAAPAAQTAALASSAPADSFLTSRVSAVEGRLNFLASSYFVLEPTVGYQRWGGFFRDNGANFGNAGAAVCYDAPRTIAVCAEGRFIFGGQRKENKSIYEAPATVPVGASNNGASYNNQTSVDGQQVTQTRPQWAADLRVMSPDLTSSSLDARVGVYLRGVLGEVETATSRTRTSQLQDAVGTAIGAPHVVSDRKIATRNYTELIPGVSARIGIGQVYGQVSAGYSPRLRDAVVNADAGIRFDF